MNDFKFKIPQNIEFGVGSLKKLPEIMEENNSKHVFLISDRGLESIGVVKKVKEIIEAGGIKCTSYLDVVPNPTIGVVNEATKSYKESKATSIVALGGGSPLDVAKAVGVLATYGGDIRDYEGMNKVPGPIVPTIAIPTTAGTGSEATASCVITDEEKNYKFSMISYETLPKYAILDPELIMTAPASIAASTGIDALSGSNFAGIAFAWAKLGNVHAMSHPVSAFFHVPHGVANSIILPTVMEYNALVDNGRYEVIYNYISEDNEVVKDFKPEMLVEVIKKLNADLKIPKSLSEVGVTEDMIEEMSKDAMKSGNVLANPRETNLEDMVELYKKAL